MSEKLRPCTDCRHYHVNHSKRRIEATYSWKFPFIHLTAEEFPSDMDVYLGKCSAFGGHYAGEIRFSACENGKYFEPAEVAS